VNINDIEMGKDEVKDFQAFAPKSPAAILLTKMIGKIEEEAMKVLVDVNMEIKEIRHAQGRMDACATLNDMARKVLSVELERWDSYGREENAMGEDDLMEDFDVRF